MLSSNIMEGICFSLNDLGAINFKVVIKTWVELPVLRNMYLFHVRFTVDREVVFIHVLSSTFQLFTCQLHASLVRQFLSETDKQQHGNLAKYETICILFVYASHEL
jgi:hypothetical protein